MPDDDLHPDALREQRWFAGKHRPLARVQEAGTLPLPGAPLRLVQAHYLDQGPTERYLLTDRAAADWPRALQALLQRPVRGSAGTLALRCPAPAALARMLGGGPLEVSVPSVDQSNTLLALGDRLLVKLYRRPLPGVHPEIEIGEALRGRDAPVVEHLGSLELATDAGETIAVGVLQRFVPGADSGWEWPIGVAVADLRAGAPSPRALAFARRTGAVLAQLHAALRAAFGGDPAGAGLQRIHGDLHVAQLLHTESRLLVIDFEGPPGVALAQRRVLASPLVDLATLRRSLDHVATAAARRTVASEAVTCRWSERVLAEVSDGYRAPVDAAELWRLEVAAERRELRYAEAVLPEWAYVARAGLRRLGAGAGEPPTT